MRRSGRRIGEEFVAIGASDGKWGRKKEEEAGEGGRLAGSANALPGRVPIPKSHNRLGL